MILWPALVSATSCVVKFVGHEKLFSNSSCSFQNFASSDLVNSVSSSKCSILRKNSESDDVCLLFLLNRRRPAPIDPPRLDRVEAFCRPCELDLTRLFVPGESDRAIRPKTPPPRLLQLLLLSRLVLLPLDAAPSHGSSASSSEPTHNALSIVNEPSLLSSLSSVDVVWITSRFAGLYLILRAILCFCCLVG